jgi:hypothetical protein
LSADWWLLAARLGVVDLEIPRRAMPFAEQLEHVVLCCVMSCIDFRPLFAYKLVNSFLLYQWKGKPFSMFKRNKNKNSNLIGASK